MGELNHADAVELLGVYALDAVDEEERAAIEQHVRDCGACQREVAEHREVAAALAGPGPARAPDGLWDRIAGALEETPPPLKMPVAPVVPIERAARRRFRPLGVAAAVAAVAAVAVIGVMGVRIADDQRRIDSLEVQARSPDLQRTADAAQADPAARRVALRSPSAPFLAEVVVLPDGTGYLLASNLPELSADRTYQLWAVVGTSKISVGVLGTRPGVAAFKAPGRTSAFAITSEAAGGVEVSQNQPLVVGTV